MKSRISFLFIACIVGTAACGSVRTAKESGRAVASTAVAASSAGGWHPQVIATSSSPNVDISSVTVADDGSAVAFANVETSCCSNNIFGWFRSVDGKWTDIPNTQSVFVDGAFGGPGAVESLDDRFVAIGTRHGDVGDETQIRTTAWMSQGGVQWSATDEPAKWHPIGLTKSPERLGLIGAWSADDGSIQLRYMANGEQSYGYKWDENVTIKPDQNLPHDSFAVIPGVGRGDDVAPRPALFGWSEGNVRLAIASDMGDEWDTTTLELPKPDTGFSVENGTVDKVVNIDGQLIAYGSVLVSQDDAPDVWTSDTVAWTSTDGTTFSPAKIDDGCAGSLTNITVDEPAPETTVWAVCRVDVGNSEGDYQPSTTQLMLSHDGLTFAPALGVPSQWATPQEHITVGPIVVDKQGVIGVVVGISNTNDTRTMTLWEP
jgi:hypothetical protein